MESTWALEAPCFGSQCTEAKVTMHRGLGLRELACGMLWLRICTVDVTWQGPSYGAPRTSHLAPHTFHLFHPIACLLLLPAGQSQSLQSHCGFLVHGMRALAHAECLRMHPPLLIPCVPCPTACLHYLPAGQSQSLQWCHTAASSFMACAPWASPCSWHGVTP
jgi:hypothetical protein